MSSYSYGIQGQVAPDWGVAQWYNLSAGKTSLERTDFEGKVLYLYCFQSWCPGCHSHGFPTLKAVREYYQDNPQVDFVAIQTVFEGFDTNTFERIQETAQQYDLDIPFGHDPGSEGQRSLVMQNYLTGGTPWTILIDQKGIVRFNDFQAQPGHIIQIITNLLENNAHQYS